MQIFTFNLNILNAFFGPPPPRVVEAEVDYVLSNAVRADQFASLSPHVQRRAITVMVRDMATKNRPPPRSDHAALVEAAFTRLHPAGAPA